MQKPSILATIALFISTALPACAQVGDAYSVGSAGNPGALGRYAYHTPHGADQWPTPFAPRDAVGKTFTTGPHTPNTYTPGPQNGVLPRTYSAGLAKVFGPYPGLPPTVMDSFVQQAGGLAYYIYGDEGTNGPPPLYSFNKVNRIDSGIIGNPITNSGLTTGHESWLPSAWGTDEFSGAPESYISGDHVLRFGQGRSAGYVDPTGNGLPGGSPGGGYYDPASSTFPNAAGN